MRASTRMTGLFLAAGLVLGTLSEAGARPLDEIRRSGELRLCVATSNPPDGVVSPEGCTGYCEFTGLVRDLSDAFAKTLGVSTRFWVSSWDEFFQNADGVTVKEAVYTPELFVAERCDMIASPLVALDWRLLKMDMTCFVPSRMVIVVPKDRAGDYAGIEDLAGKTVAVEQSMSLHSWIEDQNATVLAADPVEISFRDYKDSIAAVDLGEVDFTVVAILDALWQTRHQAENAVVAFAVGPVDEGCWGYPKGADDIATEIAAFFADQRGDADSDLNRIWTEYFGYSFFEFLRIVSAVR